MAQPNPETITREEFDKRLNELNKRRAQELQQAEEEQMRVEQLLTHHEHTLDEIEVNLLSTGELASSSVVLRKRLKELANKTAEMAALL